MSSTTIVNNIYKSRKIVLEQLKERGFDISNYDNFSYTDVRELHLNDTLDMLISNYNEEKIYIKYYFEKKLTKDAVFNVVSELFDDEVLDKETDEVLIIAKADPNDTLLRLLNQLYESSKIYMNIVNMKRLQFNVLKHSLVGENTKLNEKEISEFYKKYSITEPKNQIKEISRFDPVAIALGLRPDDICKTIRNGPTSGKEIDYRYTKNKAHFKQK